MRKPVAQSNTVVKFRLYALQAQLRFDNFTGDTFNGWISLNTISRSIEYHRCYIHSFNSIFIAE